MGDSSRRRGLGEDSKPTSKPDISTWQGIGHFYLALTMVLPPWFSRHPGCARMRPALALTKTTKRTDHEGDSGDRANCTTRKGLSGGGVKNSCLASELRFYISRKVPAKITASIVSSRSSISLDKMTEKMATPGGGLFSCLPNGFPAFSMI